MVSGIVWVSDCMGHMRPHGQVQSALQSGHEPKEFRLGV